MKNIIATIAITAMTIPGFSQVIIGGSQGASGTNTASVLMDFATDQNRGMILPYVSSINATPTEGSILLDVTDPENAKVMYYNGDWVNLSNDADDVASDITGILSSQPSGVSEPVTAGAIIGSDTTDAIDGVLVLESTTKAMVLPQVNSVQDIVSPSPGMMVYVTPQSLLAVYNGQHWAFWKAAE